MNLSFHHTQKVKTEALALGFDYCGISKVAFLEQEAPRLEAWLHSNAHGKMQYMENHFDMRLNPALLVEESKSVISLLYNYFPSKALGTGENKISKYAYGIDYHKVIRKKLKTLVVSLQGQIGAFNARVFVDSAPVLEKAWAEKSGLGWRGKNTNLINKRSGSFYFLAEIICDLELMPDGPVKDHCGTCTRCIDACPTDALSAYYLDATKCISYLTIELKDETLPQEFVQKTAGFIYGCDICQDVCPWNRFSVTHNEPQFDPSNQLRSMQNHNWEELTEDIFNSIFAQSAVKRTKFAGLKRNIQFNLQKVANNTT